MTLIDEDKISKFFQNFGQHGNHKNIEIYFTGIWFVVCMNRYDVIFKVKLIK